MKTFLISLGVFLSYGCMCQNTNKVTSTLPDFIKIVNGQTTFIDSSIICELSLKQLTKRLKFNDSQAKDNALEYEWGVYFDNNNDGKYMIFLFLYATGKIRKKLK